MITQRTYSLLPLYRWPIAALPHQSSWQAGRDQWLLLVVQDISPPRGFYPDRTVENINLNVESFCQFTVVR